MKEVLKAKFIAANMYIKKKTLKNNLHFHLRKLGKKKCLRYADQKKQEKMSKINEIENRKLSNPVCFRDHKLGQ